MEQRASRRAGLTRRRFLGLASAAVGLWIRPAQAGGPSERHGVRGPDSALEREHLPVLHVPRVTRNGAKVPILVELLHPMTPDHHITSVHVANDGDPIPSKGTFHLSPANGQVHLAFQARMHEGVSEVTATVECNRHGRWSARSVIEIPAGAGGCGGSAPEAGRARGDDIAGPIIRIPELLGGGAVRPGDVIHPQVKMRHPNRTGLVLRDGRFEAESAPLYLEEMEVFYGGERVSRFAMTPALSDDPFITFALRLRPEGALRVVLTNSLGRVFEATQELRLS
jgi:sulfur-oxidizing protein SoxY